MVRGAEDEARSHGYSLILCGSNEDGELDRTNLDNLYSRRVDGVLLSPSHVMAGLDRLSSRRFPIVFVDRIAPGFEGPAVVIDNFGGANQATQHLIALGHTRIATIAGCQDFCNAIDRLEGFRKALHGAGLPLLEDYLQRGDFQLESGYRWGMALLRLPKPPTAIFSGSNKMTLGLMSAITELGLRCPGNVSVLGFDDFDWAANFSPRLTTVAQPTHQMGAEAMTMLLEQIRTRDAPANDNGKRIVTLQPELRIRNSTAPPAN
jgi:DNA-binding LacI/PurR family transcriptional regulator